MARGEYDVIIIGAGHNGLIVGSYLSRAGLKCLVVEHRLEAGGGLSTEEITIAGYWNNMHSVYHEGINLMRPFSDLKVEDFNCWYVRPEVVAAMPLPGGRALAVYTDLARTKASLEQFSAKDARVWGEVSERFGPVVRDVVIPGLYKSAGRLQEDLSATELGREYLRFSQMTPAAVVDELFEDEYVKGLILHHVLIPKGAVYDYQGAGGAVIRFICQVEHSMLCVGGSHILAHALIRAYARSGGHVLATARVERVLVEGGRASGVELATGERIFARRAVVSTADLEQTLFKFVGRSKIGEAVAEKARAFSLDEFSIFSVHLNLKEPPRYKGGEDASRAFKVNIGLETPADHAALWASIRSGRLPDPPGLMVAAPTVHDPKQAPRGKHTAVVWAFVPYTLAEGTWAEVKNDYARKVMAAWSDRAVNLGPDNIEFELAISPPELFNKQINMAQGGIFMGQMRGAQLAERPFAELAHYRTPVAGLYLAGSACWPGGGVTGIPAYNAAGVIAGDLGVARWWGEPVAAG